MGVVQSDHVRVELLKVVGTTSCDAHVQTPGPLVGVPVEPVGHTTRKQGFALR